MVPPNIPVFLKHVVVAIYNGDSVHGSGQKKFEGAMLIARAQLTKYGYLTAGSDTGAVAAIQLTSSGARKEQEHRGRTPRPTGYAASTTSYRETARSRSIPTAAGKVRSQKPHLTNLAKEKLFDSLFEKYFGQAPTGHEEAGPHGPLNPGAKKDKP